jgi:hypothetical protein
MAFQQKRCAFASPLLPIVNPEKSVPKRYTVRALKIANFVTIQQVDAA